MRDDRQRLVDIVDATDLILKFVGEKTRSSAAGDPLLQSAILYQLYVIGEAVARTSDSLRSRYSQVPWAQIQGFRNRVAHEYFKLDIDVIWATVETEIPELRKQIQSILAIEFPE